jgi:hypothetical protein
MPLLNISTGDGVEYDDADVVDVDDGTVDGPVTMGFCWRFDNVMNSLFFYITTKLVEFILGGILT